MPPPGALVPLAPRGATTQEPPGPMSPPDDRKDPNVKPPIDPASASQPAWLPRFDGVVLLETTYDLGPAAGSRWR